MKTPIIILLTLFVAIFVYEQVIKEKQIKKQNEIIKTQLVEIIHLKKQIIELKDLPIGMIVIGRNTLQCVTALPDRHLHIERINKGKNFYSYAIRADVRIELYIWKYK